MQTIKLEADTVGQVVYKNEPDWSEVSLKKTVEGTDEPIAGAILEVKYSDGSFVGCLLYTSTKKAP